MAHKGNIITSFDIGSSAIKGLVVQRKRGQTQGLGVLAHFSLPADGLRKGVVVDPDRVTEQLKKVKAKLRTIAKPYKLGEAYVNINGGHISSYEGRGAVAISRADQKVSAEDIERVLEEAKNINLPFNQEILDIFPIEYIVDSQAGLTDIEGMKGIKLEVRALAISAFSLYVKKLVEAVLNSDTAIAEVVVSPLAASRAVLTPQQKELGAALVDIGAETTGIAVFEEKKLIHLAVLPVGSANITRDIAIGLQSEIDIAEAIKIKFGSYIFKNKRKKEKIKTAEGKFFEFDSQKMVKAGRARVSELLKLINKELRKINRQQGLPAGLVLTGGGSNLSGLVDFSKKQLKLPIKKGVCKGFIGLEPGPELSVACGLALTSLEDGLGPFGGGESFFTKLGSKLKQALKTFLP